MKCSSTPWVVFCLFMLASIARGCVPVTTAPGFPSTTAFLRPSSTTPSETTTAGPSDTCIAAPNITPVTETTTTETTTAETTPTTTEAEMVNCSEFVSCELCVENRNCGWCDTFRSCLRGQPDASMGVTCPNWFYWNCLTTDDSTTCSDQITKLNCLPNCTGTSPKEQFLCQKCTDFHDCFEDSGGTCLSWDDTKCPGGKLNPNLTEPQRMNLTVIKPEVLNVDQSNTLYICDMVDSDGPVTVIATEDPTENYTDRILSSSQAGGILHKVLSVTERGNWTFTVAVPAELPEVIEHAEFTYTVTDSDSTETTKFVEDDTPADTVITRLRETLDTFYSPYHGHDMTGVAHLYKLVGQTIVTSDNVTERRSVLVVPKASAVALSMDDIIFAEDTVGYLEVVDETQPLSPHEILLKTHLAQLDTAATSYNADTLILSETKAFACGGGEELMSGINVFDSAVEESWMAPGNVIVGRATTAVALQIAAIYEGGDFVLYEGYPVISVGESGEVSTSFGPNDLTSRRRRKKREMYGIRYTDTIHIPFSINCSYFMKINCKTCKDVMCQIKIDLRPSITIAAALNVDFFPFSIDAGIGAQLVFDAGATLEISFTPEATFSRTAKLFGPVSVHKFAIPVGVVPVPGNIDVTIIQKVSLSLKGDLVVGATATGKLVRTFTGKYGDVHLPPDRQSRSAVLTPWIKPLKSFKKVTFKIDTGVEVQAAWPSVGASATAALGKRVERWRLPEWIKKKIIKVLNSTKLDVFVKVEGGFREQFTAESCKCCRMDKEKPHQLKGEIGIYIEGEIGAHVLFITAKLLKLMFFWPLDSITTCHPEDHGRCSETDDTCAGKLSLAFVIDDTGSMGDNIDGVIAGVERTFEALTGPDSDINDFVLVRFNDPSVGPVIQTNISSEFLAALRGITVSGGHDCPEMAMHGLQLAINAVHQGSTIFHFTDASAKDYSLKKSIIRQLDAKKCEVDYVLSGSCDADDSPSDAEFAVGNVVFIKNNAEKVAFDDTVDCDPVIIERHPQDQVYYDTARASNGQVFNVETDDISDVISYIETRFHGRPVESIDSENATRQDIHFYVDSGFTSFSISISGDRPVLNIFNPNGLNVNYTKVVDLANVLVATVRNPVEGEWKAVTEVACGSYSVEITGTSAVKFQFGYSQNIHTDFPDRVTVAACTEDLIITGVISGPLENGLPKAIELYTVHDINDMEIYGIFSDNGAGGANFEEFMFPPMSFPPGQFIYVATEEPQFRSFFGFLPTYVHQQGAFVTGNNTVQLYKLGTLIDQFGYIDRDGSGTAWDYRNGWAYRNNGTCQSAEFNLSDWHFSGPHALTSALTNEEAIPNQWPLADFSV